MSTLTKLALGMMGQLRPAPAKGDAATTIALPAPRKTGGITTTVSLSPRISLPRNWQYHEGWKCRYQRPEA